MSIYDKYRNPQLAKEQKSAYMKEYYARRRAQFERSSEWTVELDPDRTCNMIAGAEISSFETYRGLAYGTFSPCTILYGRRKKDEPKRRWLVVGPVGKKQELLPIGGRNAKTRSAREGRAS